MRGFRVSRAFHGFLLLSPVAVIVVTAIVMVAWGVQSDFLIRVREAFAPMQFNTALSLHLCGWALLAAVRRRIWLSRVLSVLVIGVLGLAFFQSWAGKAIGIDEAISTALCLLGVSVLALWDGVERYSRLWFVPLTTLAVFVLLHAGLAGLEYLLPLHVSYAWGSHSRMAVATVLCLLALSAGHGLRLGRFRFRAGMGKQEWLPALVAGLLMILPTFVRQIYVENDARRAKQLVEAEGRTIRRQLEMSLDHQVSSLIRMAKRWEFARGLSYGIWKADAHSYLEHLPGAVWIARLDREGKSRWLHSLHPDRAGFEARAVMPQMEVSNFFQPQVSLERMPQESDSWLTIGVPLRIGGQLTGAMAMALRLEPFLDSSVVTRDFYFSISADDQVHHHHHSQRGELTETQIAWTSSVLFNYRNTQWKIHVTPHITFARPKGMTPSVVLVAGGILTNLFGFMVLLLLKGQLMQKKTLLLLQGTRKRDREIRRQHLQLVATSRLAALGEMAAGMAHEINNPLAIINGKVRLIRTLLESPSRSDSLDQMDRHVSELESTVDRIARIIQGLRSFAKDSKDEQEHWVSVEWIRDQALGFVSRRYENAGVDLKISMPVDGKTADHPLYCRPTQITQVIYHLLTNAFRAVSEQKEKKIHVEISQQDGGWQFAVEDSGPGIPRHLQNRILEPFFTTLDIGQGMGMGLSIAKGIVEEHRGWLRLDQQSVSTRFIFWIPGRPQEERRGAA